jgi:hypothetical protein
MRSTRNLGGQDKLSLQRHHPDFFALDKGSWLSANTDMEQRQLPAPGERVVVQCPGFRCLAYRDASGGWREAYDKEQLPEVLEIG